MKFVVDTNVLLQSPEVIEEVPSVITSTVLREIESLERRKNDQTLQYQVRKAKRVIEDAIDNSAVELVTDDLTNGDNGYDNDYADNVILSFAVNEGYGLITNDLLLKYKALSEGVDVRTLEQDGDEYTGVKNLYYDDNDAEHRELMNKIQTSITEEVGMYYNPLGMKQNEYLIVWDINSPTYKVNDDGEQVRTGSKEMATYKFNGVKLERIEYENLHSSFLGTVRPRNTRQRLAFDLLQNDEITVKGLFGIFGSGKDYLMLSHAIQAVKEGKFDKIVWVRNNIEVKDTNSIGFLPDGLEDKLKPFLAPLQDFLGGEESLEMFIDEGKVEVQHLGFIRGRDIKNSIIYVTECQSNTKEHIKLLLGRVGEGSQIWLNGDDQQTDNRKFDHDNGVKVLQQLAGNKLYGQVTMDMTERSKTARLAEALNE